MNSEELLRKAEERLKPWTIEASYPESSRLDVVIAAENLVPAAKALLAESDRGYLAAITGIDHPAADESSESQIEVLYTFCNGPALVNFRITIPYSKPVLPTICNLIPSATLYEREMIEMFGVTFDGTPNTERLLLPDEWPDGVYPLRKSFTGLNEQEIA